MFLLASLHSGNTMKLTRKKVVDILQEQQKLQSTTANLE